MENLSSLANSIRILSAEAVEKAKSGHPGMPMGMADIATVLFANHLNFNPKNPKWANRDRFILSNGHGSMLLYSLLYLTGYEDISIEDIKNFRQLHSKTCGHPEYGELEGIETTTGPLGQGLANGVGMALAEKILNARDAKAINHHTYVFLGDGCLMEGISHEALSLAGNLNLNKLILIFDDNSISIDGRTNLATKDDTKKRLEAYGFYYQEIDGHNFSQIDRAIANAKNSKAPSFIACKTLIGKGSPNKQDSEKSHGSPLGEKEIEAVRSELNWHSKAFEIPANIKKAWEGFGERGAKLNKAWDKENPHYKTKEIDYKKLDDELLKLKQDFLQKNYSVATRKSSQDVLDLLNKLLPQLIGGSADLTESNLTKTSHSKAISANDFTGNYIYYGVREHAMGAIMNGLALHGEFIPYGGTFFVFSDYVRPAIRLSALMKQQVIFVLTHDSIGLGEDGPTHQPIEHLASFRAMPNVNMLRPCDAIEVIESYQKALHDTSKPTLIALSRQKLDLVRKDSITENLTLKGGYIISKSTKKAGISLLASGSEVNLAVQVQKALLLDGIYADVVSVPSFADFVKQDENYKKRIVPSENLKVVIEAGSSFGWEKIAGNNALFFCIDRFGLSAPAEKIYTELGLSVENIVSTIKQQINLD
jgi:transketolase